ncbi:MAG: YfiR family protein [Planctomycetes bacterium]|nr:YfiR family protein [Planctomycetota bacterium]
MLTALATLMLVCAAPAQDGQNKSGEHAATLRAVFVLKLAPYLATDGARKATEYRIGLVGDDAVTAVAEKALADKKVDKLPVTVVVVDLDAAKQGKNVAQYDLLYVATTVAKVDLESVVKAHADKPVPIVCEQAGFAAMGGGVQLFVKDNGLKLEVNGDALKKQGLQVSANLQKLSQRGPR